MSMVSTTATRAAAAKARAVLPCLLRHDERNGWKMIVLVGRHLRRCGVSARTVEEFVERATWVADDRRAVATIAGEYTELHWW
jgi:hypothetical protein